MPIYEYRCRTCGETFSRMRRQADRREPLPCPGCDSPETALALSVPGHVGAGASTGPADACGMDGGGCCGGACMN